MVSTRAWRCLVCASLAVTGSAASAAETVTYSYDALGRLTGSSISGGPNNGRSTSTSFDPAGNRSSYSVSGLSEELRNRLNRASRLILPTANV